MSDQMMSAHYLSIRRRTQGLNAAVSLVADRLCAVRASVRPGAMVGRLRVRGLSRRAPLGAEVRARLRATVPARRPPIDVAVCAIFRDEAPYLAEWVAFHRTQGVQRFWLYDNRSVDCWRSALEPNADVVEVTPWPDEPGQYSAYLDCLKRHRRDARWIAFLDIDEFLFSPTGLSLKEVLREFEHHSAVVANWRMYGTSGHEHPPAGLVVENYLMRGADDHRDNRWVKCILDPRKAVDCVEGPHRFQVVGSAVGEDHRPVRSAVREPPTVDLLRINHYYSRSVAEYAKKRARPRAADGYVGDTAQMPPDEVRDEVMLQFLQSLKDELMRRPAERSQSGEGPPLSRDLPSHLP